MKTIRVSVDPPILNCHIELQECWVCSEPFFDRGGFDPTVVSHVHHVVPQAAGGKNGPTVTLCTNHHDLLHRIAEAWVAQKNNSDMELGPLIGKGLAMLNSVTTARARERVTYLSYVVARSLYRVRDDVNKPVLVSVQMTRAEAADLDLLAKALRSPNRGAALKEAFHRQLRATFPLREPPK